MEFPGEKETVGEDPAAPGRVEIMAIRGDGPGKPGLREIEKKTGGEEIEGGDAAVWMSGSH